MIGHHQNRCHTWVLTSMLFRNIGVLEKQHKGNLQLLAPWVLTLSLYPQLSVVHKFEQRNFVRQFFINKGVSCHGHELWVWIGFLELLHKVLQTWQLNTTDVYSPTVLEVRSPKSRCLKGWFLQWTLRENLPGPCLSLNFCWQAAIPSVLWL